MNVELKIGKYTFGLNAGFKKLIKQVNSIGSVVQDFEIGVKRWGNMKKTFPLKRIQDTLKNEKLLGCEYEFVELSFKDSVIQSNKKISIESVYRFVGNNKIAFVTESNFSYDEIEGIIVDMDTIDKNEICIKIKKETYDLKELMTQLICLRDNEECSEYILFEDLEFYFENNKIGIYMHA